MIQTLTTSTAAHLLMEDENANWSWAGATALVEFLENIEEETGEPMEFDRVAIRCEWSEYESAAEAVEELSGDGIDSEPLAWLEQRTTVIAVDGDRVIVLQF